MDVDILCDIWIIEELYTHVGLYIVLFINLFLNMCYFNILFNESLHFCVGFILIIALQY